MVSFTKSCLLLSFVLTLPVHSVKASSSITHSDNTFPFSSAERASADELEKARGREGIDITALNNVNLEAILKDNVANNITTGTNIIDHGAFVGASGVFSVIQNTGNNVIIQESTNFNVIVTP